MNVIVITTTTSIIYLNVFISTQWQKKKKKLKCIYCKIKLYITTLIEKPILLAIKRR